MQVSVLYLSYLSLLVRNILRYNAVVSVSPAFTVARRLATDIFMWKLQQPFVPGAKTTPDGVGAAQMTAKISNS